MDEGGVFRFAPSPNGVLHLGHAYSAFLNDRLAREAGARLLLRFEDIDMARCSPLFETSIRQDLAWLGIAVEEPVRRQSEHFSDYRSALDALRGEGLVYPGFMTRGQIRHEAERYAEREGRDWPRDPDGAPLYPRIDRALTPSERQERIAAGQPFAWRLDMEAAMARIGELAFVETGFGAVETVAADPRAWGDVVLARRDIPTSYHLSVVVDDALQGVTTVVRGRDLMPSTSVHRLLQALLGLPAPRYHHHELILGPDGRKLSKSVGDTGLATLRTAGLTPADVVRMLRL